ncbi:MAG TPA: hypothetical protein VIN69_08365 [Candidatus Limnocylindria bacterium]|jgi:hypothetical protein
MEPLDIAAFASFVVLALAWVVLPIKSPAVPTPAVAFEEAAVAA